MYTSAIAILRVARKRVVTKCSDAARDKACDIRQFPVIERLTIAIS